MVSTGLVAFGGNTSQEKTVRPWPNSWLMCMARASLKPAPRAGDF